MTNRYLLPFLDAVARLEEAWADAGGGSESFARAACSGKFRDWCGAAAAGGLHTEIVAGIARESRPELGSAALSKEQGFRSPAAMVAAATGGSKGDAFRLVKVGEATAPRESRSLHKPMVQG